MDYALAKALKDAGYPQERRRGYACAPMENDAEFVYTPTLPELIEAVKNLRLKFTLNGFEDHWNAHCSTTESRSGSTPEEAVARLWLALHVDNLTS